MSSNTFGVTITAVDRVSAVVNKINQSIARTTKPARDLQTSLSGLGKELGINRVADGMKSIGSAARDAVRQVGSMVPALAAIAGIGTAAGIAALATEFGKAGAEINRTSGVTGVAAGELQAYRGAAKLAGLSSDDMTGSLKTLGRTIEDATFGRNQDALVMMQKFGMRLRKTKEGAVDATLALKEVANAIVAQKGNVQAQALIAGTFGVESLLPLLQKGGKGIDEFVSRAKSMGLVLSDKDLARAQHYNETMLRLDGQATKLKYAFGEAMAPAVERVLNVVGKLIKKYGDVAATKVAEYVEKFANWLDQVDWDKTADSIAKFVDQIGGVKGIAIAIAAISFAGPIADVLSLIANLTLLATSAAPAAAKALAGVGAGGAVGGAAGVVAAGATGYGIGSLIRSYYDDYVRWSTGGERWSLNDYWTGTNRHDHAATGGYTQEELDSVKDGGGAKLTGSAKQRLGAADLFSGLESKYGLPSGLLDSVWNTESSRGDPKWMRSPKGAMGHFGFMPATASQYGVTDPNDLTQSATSAARMYSDLLKANGGDLNKALAAYNWGQGNLSSKGLENAPKETRDYIAKVRSQMGGGSLYSAQTAPIVAANQPGAVAGAGATEDAGKVHVEIQLVGAPAGTKASVRSTGNVTASVKIGRSLLTEANI
ncbi:lytic transglycosylase domain-containing protein [Ralstonia solanacearum]|uniref:lytic transglycosylase domain-containing protein n=1 Tax=Ralstonia solanacearum TaxID=305 RepID=UPI0001D952CF|nr:lytic transglycosylase domain-containing protein [Ralstonia solanacearum]CBJ50353.1 hypothethical protein [Ralstonia solanacearum PSI07]